MHSNFWVLEECCHRMLFSPYRIPAYTPSKPQFGSFGLDQGLNACILIEKHTTIRKWFTDCHDELAMHQRHTVSYVAIALGPSLERIRIYPSKLCSTLELMDWCGGSFQSSAGHGILSPAGSFLTNFPEKTDRRRRRLKNFVTGRWCSAHKCAVLICIVNWCALGGAGT